MLKSKRIGKIDSVKFYHNDPHELLNDVNSVPELQYLANIAMSTTHRSKVSPEVPLLISHEAYARLVNYYGGTSIYIPTRDELQSGLLGVMSYYYHNIKGMGWTAMMRKIGLTPTKGSRRLLRNRWNAFKEIIESTETKIPDLDRTADLSVPTSPAPIRCGDTFVPYDTYMKVIRTVTTDLSENGIVPDAIIDTVLRYYDET